MNLARCMRGVQPPAVREIFARVYRDVDGHRHVHGANLGVCASAYQRAGGFPPLACREDVALVERLMAIGARIEKELDCEISPPTPLTGNNVCDATGKQIAPPRS